MDSFEIQSAIRNIAGLHDEDRTKVNSDGVPMGISPPELLRNINLAQSYVSQYLLMLIKDDLIRQIEVSGQSGNYEFPKDVLLFVTIYRKNSSGTYKECLRIPSEKKPLIGNVQYPSDDEDNPIVVQVGSKLVFYPTLSSTDIQIEYRLRIPDLIYGKATSPNPATSLTFDQYASERDDIYNDSWLALYKINSDDGLEKVSTTKITDYNGSTKTATVNSPEASKEYVYGSVPLLPDEFHGFIIDQSLVNLKLGGFYNGDISQAQVDARLKAILSLHGIDYDTKVEANNNG